MHLTQFWVRCVCPHNTITQSRVYSSRLTIASCRFPVVAGWKFRIAHSELAWHRVLIARTQLSLTGQLAYVPRVRCSSRGLYPEGTGPASRTQLPGRQHRLRIPTHDAHGKGSRPASGPVPRHIPGPIPCQPHPGAP